LFFLNLQKKKKKKKKTKTKTRQQQQQPTTTNNNQQQPTTYDNSGLNKGIVTPETSTILREDMSSFSATTTTTTTTSSSSPSSGNFARTLFLEEKAVQAIVDSKPAFRNKRDALALLIHCILKQKGFRLVGYTEDQTLPESADVDCPPGSLPSFPSDGRLELISS